jgi:hypothetical protein
MSTRRLWMAHESSGQKPTAEFTSETIGLENLPLLADLMDRANTGTIDHEGETLEQCTQEMPDTILGVRQSHGSTLRIFLRE